MTWELVVRKSASELTVLAFESKIRRPDPPPRAHRGKAANEWRAIVNRLSTDHFPRESHGIWAYCRHIVAARRVAQILRHWKRIPNSIWLSISGAEGAGCGRPGDIVASWANENLPDIDDPAQARAQTFDGKKPVGIACDPQRAVEPLMLRKYFRIRWHSGHGRICWWFNPVANDAVDGAHSAALACHMVIASKRTTMRGAIHGRG